MYIYMADVWRLNVVPNPYEHNFLEFVPVSLNSRNVGTPQLSAHPMCRIGRLSRPGPGRVRGTLRCSLVLPLQ